MRIDCDLAKIEILDEPTYCFGSTDNLRIYPTEWCAPGPYELRAKHGILVDGDPLVVFGASSGTCVHEHSALQLRSQVVLAVGDHLVSFCPLPYHFNWSLKVDTFVCFGVHYKAENDALISHGELEIARISEDGRILWSSSGADIFTEGLSLLPDCVEAVDFNGKEYRFNYVSGVQYV